MNRTFMFWACLLGGAAVALGAFGAHALKESLSEQSLATYETAVRYQFYHVFALALTALVYRERPLRLTRNAGRCFIGGIIIFCGSLYLLTALPQYRWLGAITPIGGLCFIAGWIQLAIAASSKQ